MSDTPLATTIVIAAAIIAVSIGLMHLAAITIGGIFPGLIGMLLGIFFGIASKPPSHKVGDPNQ